MRTAGSEEAVCGGLQIEKGIRERRWSRKKNKATRLLISRLPGRDKSIVS